jgi:hypothetical protein
MKVKIIKAAKPTYWYASRIGQEFEVRKPTKKEIAIFFKSIQKGFAVVDTEKMDIITRGDFKIIKKTNTKK